MRHMLILPLLFISCLASAEDVSRDVPAFNTIRSRSAFNVTVEVGKAQSITIRGNDKFTGKVVTEVFGNELLISYKEKNSVRIADDAQVIITVPELNSFKMEGAGVTRLKNINANDFSISYEGAGKLVASGKTRSLHLAARGIGLVDTKELIAERADVNIEGVGAVSVYARDRLNASVQGIGSLTYYGNPRSLSKSVEGIGSIKAGD
ncbi:MAG: DUF2807 domain-containing protein [Burkholderiaceae bacterium]|nr:DUF2807 domain-containing protein [Burkholderiaceae bacterium]